MKLYELPNVSLLFLDQEDLQEGQILIKKLLQLKLFLFANLPLNWWNGSYLPLLTNMHNYKVSPLPGVCITIFW